MDPQARKTVKLTTLGYKLLTELTSAYAISGPRLVEELLTAWLLDHEPALASKLGVTPPPTNPIADVIARHARSVVNMGNSQFGLPGGARMVPADPLPPMAAPVPGAPVPGPGGWTRDIAPIAPSPSSDIPPSKRQRASA